MRPTLIDIVDKLSDPAVLGAISTSSRGSIGEAAFEAVRDELTASFPEYASLLSGENVSKYEIGVVNDVIERAATTIAEKASSMRDGLAEEQAKDLFVDKTKTAVRVDGWEAASQNAILDDTVTDTVKSKALLSAATDYIESGDTTIDRLRRAVEVQNNPYSATSARVFAGKAVNAFVNEAVENVGVRPTEFNPASDTNIGWVQKYDSRDEFLDHVAGTMGIDRKTVDENPNQFGPLGQRYTDLKKQYDADATASIRQSTRLNKAADAAAGRKKDLDVDEIFDTSELGTAIKDPDAIGEMTSMQLRGLIETDTVGYAGGRAPKALVDAVVKNYPDPRYARLNAEFWAAHTSAVNPTLHNNMSSEAQNAMMAGAIWGEISSMNTPNDVATSQYQGAVKLMTEMIGGGLGITGESAEAKVAKEAVGKAMDTMFSGAGYAVDGTWLSIDDTPYNGAELYSNMDAVDQTQFVNIHLTATALATSVPGLDPTVVTSRLMSQQGYQPYLDKDGKPSLVYNPTLQSEDGTLYTAMPYPSDMNSKKYKEYLFAKEREAQDVVNAARVAAGEQPYTGKFVVAVEPLFNDIDAAKGRFSARVLFKGGRSMTLSGDQIKIGGLDWLEYSKK